ncbi:DUF3386 domain-containing protein [Leptolyngbya sp. PCC 6406]|uniref:DUF3386 domain-containing protein n=1 Tax=Leptolyngbya sp. PCC 6406 TaxID=1173264 RepID=UPI0002AC2C2E|nr:DUF3386 domain-containing protein [Leptolyngbya sp. PCC 6406]
MPQTLTAQDLFRAAYENRYTWDAQFPGYRADVTLEDDHSIHRGQIQVAPDLKFEVFNVEDPTAQRMIKSQIWEITIHRVRHSFEETHGDNTFEIGKTDDTGAVEILVGGAAMGNRYKVRDNTVCFVHRAIRDVIVNIHTFDTLETEAGYLSTGYRSLYLDPETGLTKGAETIFEDTFEQVGGYYLLTRRCIRTEEAGQPKITTLLFSNLSLLPRP